MAREPKDRDEHPSLSVVYATGAPRIDGDLGDAAWGFAEETGALLEPRSGKEAPLEASAKMLWDDRYLYVGIGVRDLSLRASHRKHDEPLCEQDCVGLFLDPNSDGQSFFEIQLSPRGVVFDTRHEAGREPTPSGHVSWSSEVRAAVRVQGELDDEVADRGYDLELAIPWHAFVTTNARTGGAPRSGSQWAANLFVLDRQASGQRAAAWSASSDGDFQAPEHFGSVRFERAPSAMTARRSPVTISPETAQRLPNHDLRTNRKLDRAAIRQFRQLYSASPVEPSRTKLESDEPHH